MSGSNWFKATSPSDRSGDILVSFDAKWRDLFTRNSIECIVRRRYPKSFAPKRMYVYVGSPHSLLIGFVRVTRLRIITPTEGLQILATAGLTKEELDSYFKGYERLGCYAVSPVALFRQPLSLEALRARSGFSPPQSFVAISTRASDWLARQELVGSRRDARRRQAISEDTGSQR